MAVMAVMAVIAVIELLVARVQHRHLDEEVPVLIVKLLKPRDTTQTKYPEVLLIATVLLYCGASLAAVDVNEANVQALQQIKGIGAKTAQRIVAERARGPFESLEHLSERLSGIGPKTIIKLKAAGLCAGSPQVPCQQVNGGAEDAAAPPVGHRGKRNHRVRSNDVATPEILQLP